MTPYNLLRSGTQEMEELSEKVRQMAVEGQEQIRSRKDAAMKSHKQADNLNRRAQDFYRNSQRSMQEATDKIAEISPKLKMLFGIINSKEGTFSERAKKFQDLAGEIDRNWKDVEKLMFSANESLNEGQQASDQAFQFVKKAQNELIQLANEAAKNCRHQEKVANEMIAKCQDSQKENGRMRELVKDLQECLEESQKLLAKAVAKIQEAQQQVTYTFGEVLSACSSTVGGLYLGAMVGLSGGWLLAGAALATVGGVYAFAIGISLLRMLWITVLASPRIKRNLQDTQNDLTFKSDTSTGYYGRYVQRKQSQTEGVLEVNLGGEKMQIKANFNKRMPVDDVALLKLQSQNG